MGYSNDDLGERLDLLTRVLADDVQTKLCREIIATLTDEERKTLVEWALKSVAAQVPAMVERAIQARLAKFVEESVAKAIEAGVTAQWKTLATKVDGMVKARVATYATEDYVGKVAEHIVPPQLHTAVRSTWRSILASVPR
jgi:hypothetical protein